MPDTIMTEEQRKKLLDLHLAKSGSKRMTFKAAMDLMLHGFETFTKMLAETVHKPLSDRIAALEAAQSKTLADAYKGTWMIGIYKRGDLVTHGGSLFLALKDTDGKPSASDEWKLIVKAGKDAR